MLEVENLVPIMAAYGCNYNAETGYFEYAGLTDLTADDCRNMLVETGMYTIEDMAFKYAYCKSRVNLLPIADTTDKRKTVLTNSLLQVNCMYAFYSSDFEKIQLCVSNTPEFGLWSSDIGSMFNGCKKLKDITGRLWVSKAINTTGAFNYCVALENVSVCGVNNDISFKDSPKLSYESVKCLVDNAANTDPITVTVHGEVYAKLSGTASEYGDHTQEEWTALMTAAAEKQISFATV